MSLSTPATAERAVIASLLDAPAKPGLPQSILELLDAAPDSFLDFRLGMLAVAIRDLRDKEREANWVTVRQRLEEAKKLDEIGGKEYLAGLMADALSLDLAACEAAPLLDFHKKRTEHTQLTARLKELESQIIAPPKESEAETISRLKKLSPIEYDRVREQEAERMGIRVTTLDGMARGRHSGARTEALQGSGIRFPKIEPWPEPVNGAEILDGISKAISSYSALPPGASDVIALWCAHTHVFEMFQCSPRLNVTSPEKGCGKTTVRDLVALFVPRPLPTENLTVAVLFRVVEAHKPTLLADECDSWIHENEELRGLLNSGHRRGGQALRCEGENREVRAFNVFGPTLLCGIGSLPGTLHDRSIIVRLARAKPGEIRRRFDSRRTESESKLCRKLARWTSDIQDALLNTDPVMPDAVHNRVADNWRPLFAIAQAAGGDWRDRALTAFNQLAVGGDADEQGLGISLLSDIRRIFEETGIDFHPSKTVVEQLHAMSDRPWGEANRGRAISEAWLSKRLRGFGISPRQTRTQGARARGYHQDDFAEAFARYLPEIEPPNAPDDAPTPNPGLYKCASVPEPINTGLSSTFTSEPGQTGGTLVKPHGTPANIGGGTLAHLHAPGNGAAHKAAGQKPLKGLFKKKSASKTGTAGAPGHNALGTPMAKHAPADYQVALGAGYAGAVKPGDEVEF